MKFICPDCLELYEEYGSCCGDYMVEAAKCPFCGEYYPSGRIRAYGLCADCTEDGFSFEMGLQYVISTGGEAEFFLQYLHHIRLYNKANEPALVQGFMQDFIDEEKARGRLNDKNRNYRKLRDFCFQDESHFAKYLLKQGKAVAELLKGA